MDIPYRQFSDELVNIISQITSSHFVALDLEFSGISSRRNRACDRKLTLQEVYEQTKEAATQYQILQVGLTVVHENISRGEYVACPYNFYISPIPAKEEYHGLERRWSYQSGAVSFLLKHQFRFERLFSDGVPYLSRQEESQIKESWALRDAEKAAMGDLVIQEEDKPLVDHIHSAVKEWTSQTQVEHSQDYINIPNLSTDVPTIDGVPESLSRYQMRLTHQVVRKDYPHLKTVGKIGFVRLTIRNAREDEDEKAWQARQRNADVVNAVEFRWLVEALCGGDISGIPRRYFHNAATTSTKSGKADAEARCLRACLQEKVKSRRRVLFGHNCFIDLVYLFASFIGDLPDRVEDFRKKIHVMCPFVVDTKFMASLNKRLRYKSDLETLEKEMREEQGPTIRIPKAFDKYAGLDRCHEAGYDSLMTAKVGIRLSCKLAREGITPKRLQLSRAQLVVKSGETIIVNSISDSEDEAEDDEYATPKESTSNMSSFVDTLASKLSAVFVNATPVSSAFAPITSAAEIPKSLTSEEISLPLADAKQPSKRNQSAMQGKKDRGSQENSKSSAVANTSTRPLSQQVSESAEATTTMEDIENVASAPIAPPPPAKARNKSVFAHCNHYEVLDPSPEADTTLTSVVGLSTKPLPPKPSSSLLPSFSSSDPLLSSSSPSKNRSRKRDQNSNDHTSKSQEDDTKIANPSILMPALNSIDGSGKFVSTLRPGGIWKTLANHLAVVAAEEGVFVLGKQ